MAAEKLTATKRTESGKGASRRARREGNIPAVIYGHNIEATPLLLPGHDLFLIVKDNINALIDLDIDGDKHLALVKDLQRHPVRRDILHVDLQAVSRDEKVDVDIPVVLVGEPQQGTTATLEEFTLTLSAPVVSIPEEIEVSIDGLEDGTVLTFADITLPEGTTADYDPETTIVSIAVPELEIPEPGEVEEALEGEEAEEAEEGAEEEESEDEE